MYRRGPMGGGSSQPEGGTVGGSPSHTPKLCRSMVLVEPCIQTGTMGSTTGWIRVVGAQRGACEEPASRCNRRLHSFARFADSGLLLQ